MSLDVTAGPPLAPVGGRPPGPPGAGPPGSDPAALFAALLAGQVQTQGKVAATIPLLRTGAATVLPVQAGEAAPSDAKTKKKADPKPTETDPAVIALRVVLVLQPPLPPIQTPTVPVTAETAVKGGPTIKQQEVMDTVSAQTPPASKAVAAMPTGELLPQLNETAVVAGPAEGIQHGADAVPQAVNVPGPTPALPVVTPGLPLTQNAATPSAMPNTTPVTPDPLTEHQSKALDQRAPDKATGILPSPVTSPALDVPSPLVAGPASPMTPPQAASPVTPAAEKVLPSADPASQQSTVMAPVGGASAPVPQTAPKTEGQSALQNGTPPANNTSRTVSSVPTAPVVSAAANIAQLPPVSAPVTDSKPTTVKVPQSAGGDKSVALKSVSQDQPRVAASSGKSSGKSSADRGGADDQPRQTANPSGDATPTSVFTPGADPSSLGKAGSTEAVVSAKPLTGAERAQVMRQIADSVSTLKPQIAPGGQGQMTVNLHPKEWGDLRLTVRVTPTVSAEGVPTTTVTAHIVASSPTVKTALEAHSGELNQALRETGMRLDRLSVTVQSPQASGHFGSATGDGQGSSRNPADSWQPSQAQASLGGGMTGGHSSAFASFSGHQGREAFQNRTHNGTVNGAEESGTEAIVPMSTRLPRPSVGFDQRV